MIRHSSHSAQATSLTQAAEPHPRPLARFFPELVEALTVLPERRFVLDGEIVVASKGRFDFAALRARLHPAASRVERLRRETPAFFVAFDLLALGGDDRELPFGERRRLLADLFASTPPTLHLTALTGDRERAARWLER